MNLPINPTLTMTIAADRRRRLVAEVAVVRIRKADRLARKAARKAAKEVAMPTAMRTAMPRATVQVPAARPQLQPIPTGAAVGRQHVASGDLEHASARVA